MKTVLISLLLASPALAKPLTDVESTYLVEGIPTPMNDAFKAALNGGNVMRCQPVEIRASKSGSSFSLKLKKHAKAD